MKNINYICIRAKNIFIASFVTVCVFCFTFIVNFTDKAVNASSSSLIDKPTIIIDAGHGGEDGGTQSSDGVLEKDINLSISLIIDRIFKTDGFETVLVRDGDYMIYNSGMTTVKEKKKSDIHNRLAMTEKYDNCILLSIHQNYFTESKYNGTQVFYSDNNAESRIIAQAIQDSVVSSVQPENEREIKKCGKEIYLLYNSSVPSVMVECGFMSNLEEARKLNNPEYQEIMAQAIVDGIYNYLHSKEIKNQGDIENGIEDEERVCVQ